VVSEGDGVEVALLGAAENVERGGAGLLIVAGSGGVDMEVNAPPSEIALWWR
jgi:hypothetical protein